MIKHTFIFLFGLMMNVSTLALTHCPDSLKEYCGLGANQSTYLMIDAKNMLCGSIDKSKTNMTLMNRYNLHIEFDDNLTARITKLSRDNIGKSLALFHSNDDLIMLIFDNKKVPKNINKDPHFLTLAVIQAPLGRSILITGQSYKKAKLFIDKTLLKQCTKQSSL